MPLQFHELIYQKMSRSAVNFCIYEKHWHFISHIRITIQFTFLGSWGTEIIKVWRQFMFFTGMVELGVERIGNDGKPWFGATFLSSCCAHRTCCRCFIAMKITIISILGVFTHQMVRHKKPLKTKSWSQNLLRALVSVLSIVSLLRCAVSVLITNLRHHVEVLSSKA